MKVNEYISPVCERKYFSIRVAITAGSPGSWDSSLDGTGGNWGGSDETDEDFGL